MHPHRKDKHITRIMSHLVRRHHQHIHASLSEHEVYAGQPPLMFTLAKEGGQSQKELASQLEIKAATLTVMLNRMEKNNLVRREVDALDQRISRIYLTDKGHQTVKVVRETLDRLEQQAMTGFTDEEKLILRSYLSRINDNIKSVSEEPLASPSDSN